MGYLYKIFSDGRVKLYDGFPDTIKVYDGYDLSSSSSYSSESSISSLSESSLSSESSSYSSGSSVSSESSSYSSASSWSSWSTGSSGSSGSSLSSESSSESSESSIGEQEASSSSSAYGGLEDAILWTLQESVDASYYISWADKVVEATDKPIIIIAAQPVITTAAETIAYQTADITITVATPIYLSASLHKQTMSNVVAALSQSDIAAQLNAWNTTAKVMQVGFAGREREVIDNLRIDTITLSIMYYEAGR